MEQNKRFENIDEGTYFVYEGGLYIRTREVVEIDDSTSIHVNALRLSGRVDFEFMKNNDNIFLIEKPKFTYTIEITQEFSLG